VGEIDVALVHVYEKEAISFGDDLATAPIIISISDP
jgi:hypothetical protein